MTSLGFENYSEALKIYLARYREVRIRPQKSSLQLARKHLEGIVENATTTGLSSTVWPKVFCGHILQVTFTRHLTGVLPMLDDTPANSIASCLDWDP